MDVWNTYKARVEQSGADRRTHDLKYARAHFRHKLLNSLSYHTVLIEGREQGVVILNKADMSEKKINALPGERLVHGGYVDYEGSKWLITEVDASNEVYESGIMLRCNHLLKWLDERGKIIEKWCIVEDGTKYLIGEKAKNIMTIGDARIAVTVPKDKDTIMLGRGRRFLIDDADSKEVLAYEITKSNRLYNNYNDQGVFRYILNEVNATDNDNMELRIADYYNWKPAAKHDSDHREQDTTLEEIVEDAKEKAEQPPNDEKEVWI